jgi:aminoglycoside phosphotransferase family enzyme/predicted kinase
VRECHGDLHLGNVALVDGAMTIFDCIEFNDRMRWIDVINEVAFTVMDVEHRGRADLAFRFLAAYLEAAGDFGGVAVLRFYVVYRAMVRAKVVRLRAAQLPDGPARETLGKEFRDCLQLAAAWAVAPRPALVLTHGFAGCGKTTLSQRLLERLGAIRIRTDVERKRLHGVPASVGSRSDTETGLYSAAATRAAYHYVAALARAALGGDRTVIVDATFLQRWQRDLFRAVADSEGISFVILDVIASRDTLRARIARRMERGGDASEADLAVLDHQARTSEALTADERDSTVVADAEATLPESQLVQLAQTVQARSRASPATQGGAAAPPDSAARLRAALAFLGRPDSYPGGTDTVAVVETHMSWVFLTDLHAWKLKKPVMTADADLRDVAARLRNAVDELQVNRRLAPDVYVGAFPLILDTAGRLTFDGDGEAVDWLVKMRRLPERRMLERLLRRGEVASADVDALATRLCAFYRSARPIGTTTRDYVRKFTDSIAALRTELLDPGCALPADLVEHVCARLLDALSSTGAFDARVRANRIVEGHGDLRPEHICVSASPQIIDGLEFSLALRAVDPVDEIAFLALECERLGAPAIAARMLEAYRERSGDAAPAPLVRFYQCYRACVRATLAIRHLQGPAPREALKWTARAKDYLELSRTRVDGGFE